MFYSKRISMDPETFRGRLNIAIMHQNLSVEQLAKKANQGQTE